MPIRAVSSGSSLKHSKWRPPYGVRWRLTVGASSTSTPLRRHSAASRPPRRSMRASSQVAASAVGDGTLADGSRSSQRSPRTPAGPSEVTSRRRPGSSCSAQKSAPVSSRTFSSNDSSDRRARSSSSMGVSMQPMRALLFDVFGTCVDWRGSVERELERRGLPIELAVAWRGEYQPQLETVRSGARPWTTLDVLHREALDRLLAARGLEVDDAAELNRIWHALDPWPDTVEGLLRLKRAYVIAPCS